jgi:hypothetical protein
MAGLSVVALSAALAVAAPVAADDPGGFHAAGDPGGHQRSGGQYAGRTSQGDEISFRVDRGHLTGVRLGVNVVCPSRRVWKVAAVLSAPIKVVNGRFRQGFSSHRRGAAGTIMIKGNVRGARVAGTVKINRFLASEHRYCSGSTTFNLRRKSLRTDTGEPQSGGDPPAFTAA